MERNIRISRPCQSLFVGLQAELTARTGHKPTFGGLVGLAVDAVSEYEQQNGPVDWFEFAVSEDFSFSGIDSYSKQEKTYPTQLNLSQAALAGIAKVRQDTSNDQRFRWRRSGGVYVGVAVRYLLLAYKLILDGKSLPIL